MHIWRRLARLLQSPLRRAGCRTVRARVHAALHGSSASIISSNCLGGRISNLAGNPYRSPTVGLFFPPDSFLGFVENLEHYLSLTLTEDAEASALARYPVGLLDDVQIHFMHYASFAEARTKWVERSARVDRSDIIVLFTDRDGAGPEHHSRFSALPVARKLMITSRQSEAEGCITYLPPRRGAAAATEVPDLFTDWWMLERVLTDPVLQSLA